MWRKLSGERDSRSLLVYILGHCGARRGSPLGSRKSVVRENLGKSCATSVPENKAYMHLICCTFNQTELSSIYARVDHSKRPYSALPAHFDIAPPMRYRGIGRRRNRAKAMRNESVPCGGSHAPHMHGVPAAARAKASCISTSLAASSYPWCLQPICIDQPHRPSSSRRMPYMAMYGHGHWAARPLFTQTPLLAGACSLDVWGRATVHAQSGMAYMGPCSKCHDEMSR